VIIECYTGRDHIEQHSATVSDRRLEHGGKLLLVAGEGAANEGRTHLHGQRADVDGRQVVHDAGLELGANVGGRGELALVRP